MKIEINSYQGKSWGSYIDNGTTTIEISNKFPLTQIRDCNTGFILKNLLEALGHEVAFQIVDTQMKEMI
jgi:hypothetical protein